LLHYLFSKSICKILALIPSRNFFQVVTCSGNTGHNVEYVLRLADWIREQIPDVRVSKKARSFLDFLQSLPVFKKGPGVQLLTRHYLRPNFDP
jgi:hypothetical protein